MKLLVVFLSVAAVVMPSLAAATPNQRLHAVLPLQHAVPEFEAFCGSFPSAEITVVQDEKKSEVLTIVVQAAIAGKYGVVLIYKVAYKSAFSEVEKIIDEGLTVHRLADIVAMKKEDVLKPRMLTRSDLAKVAADGDIFLDRLFGAKAKKVVPSRKSG
ncbi:MAG: hypothetical protein FJ399_02900 [Verrucomicrobia bacterium]|nr:hypothetical protein [Verrucomicrobiota bacterium]